MAIKDIVNNIFFNEIVREAKTGEVKVKLSNTDEEYVFNVGFNSCIEGVLESGTFGDSKPVLMINNKESLVKLLTEYVKLCELNDNIFKKYTLEERIKCYLTNIWANAIYEDFANPNFFLNRRIEFYKNKLFDFDKKTYNENIEVLNKSNIVVESSIQDMRMETPYVFKSYIIRDNEKYELPRISYGINNNQCYIYAIQNNKQEKESKFQKNIKRNLYKLNDGVSDLETEEYKNKDKDYYTENISDVSPSALLSISIFFDLLKKYGIDRVNVISLLPVRYNSRELAFEKKYKYALEHKNLTETELKKLLLEYKVENLRIQKNISDKLIRNFRRLESHFSSCLITSFPMEFDEYLHLSIKEYKFGSNELLDQAINKEIHNFSK